MYIYVVYVHTSVVGHRNQKMVFNSLSWYYRQLLADQCGWEELNLGPLHGWYDRQL